MHISRPKPLIPSLSKVSTYVLLSVQFAGTISLRICAQRKQLWHELTNLTKGKGLRETLAFGSLWCGKFHPPSPPYSPPQFLII